MSEAKDTTVIAKDARFAGELTFQNTVRVVGTVEGTVSGGGELQVAHGALCKAEIKVATLVVDGQIEGNVLVKDKLQLNAQGVIRGDVVAGKMIMAEGATLSGRCTVGPDAVKAGSVPSNDSTPSQAGPEPRRDNRLAEALKR